ncbi:MAG: hypothetical protein J6K39_02605 [Clostridia bacterium]|nr:hypothetical protein [Clostridia bacterium]
MSKKWIVLLSLAGSVVAIVLILMWTLFALSSVSVQFHSTINRLTLSQQEIVDAGGFRYGACVFFESKKASEQKIENKASESANFAYLRVINIETVFPNKFIIHVAEREELFAVENGGQTLICDRDFRVLDIKTSSENKQGEPILLTGLEFSKSNIQIGDFLDVKQEAMLKFYSVMLQNNRDLSQQLGKFKEISLGTYQDELTKKEYVSMTITTFQGQQYVVKNPEFAFANKMQLLFAAESALFNSTTDAYGNILDGDGDVIYVKEENGIYLPAEQAEAGTVALTHELLAQCSLVVDNLTLDPNVERTEKDIYYCLAKK